MVINKSQDVYEITDTYKNQTVSGQSSVSTEGNVIINITIGNKEVFYSVFPSQNSCGINASIEQFDVDLIKYLTDLANSIINQN